MNVEETDYLAHYGILRRSGRYPWGSGGHNETARSKHFLDHVDGLKQKGYSEKQIAEGFGMSINALRASYSIGTNQQRQANIAIVQRLKDKGYSPTAISQRLGIPGSTVRSYLAPGAADKAGILENTTNMLRNQVAEKTYLDVGRGNEAYLNVSSTRLDTAVEALKMEGYELHEVKTPQVSGHFTNRKVLTPPGTTKAEVYQNQHLIQQIRTISNEGGRAYGEIQPPIIINPKRVQVIYGPDGGAKADGMIYIRPKVDDVSIGGAKYAQVRVAVGDNHYLKGMAMYKEDLPDGVDIQFNTSKKSTGNKLDAMKANKDEKSYVEGGPHVLLKSVRYQILADAGTPKERVTSSMNIVDEEGAWQKWSKNMSSQMLSKQQPILAKSQLNMTYENRQADYDNIIKLTNNTVKKKLLEDFANATDSAAVHMKAAALPRTGNRIILPLSSVKPTEIYAPGFIHGEKVVLIRHPHGGVFEIPELIVNNNNREGKNLLGQARDAVGIHHTVASHLSGADFDGDTVLVIPNNAMRVRHSKALDELKNFDPRSSYPAVEGMTKMTNTQREMGEISNLITDMSLRNASHAELTQAIKHSMVVIDAEKHNLNYKLSFNDNGIKNLKKKYQPAGGAATLISRAKSPVYQPQTRLARKSEGGRLDLDTGAIRTVPTGRKKLSGEPRLEKKKKLAVTADARELISDFNTPMERIYATHSNKLKGLANKARLTEFNTPAPKMSSSAAKVYAPQVESLNHKLKLVRQNAPLERQANDMAAANVRMRKEDYPDMDEETERKIGYQALIQARIRTGAQKYDIKFDDAEWDAIQAGAISHSKLTEILQHADMENVRQHATPKAPLKMTAAKMTVARQRVAAGYPLEQIAEDLGVSMSTLERAL